MARTRQPARSLPRAAWGRRAAALVVLACAGSCLPTPVFDCGSDEQCGDLGELARCEPVGYCSVPDNRCMSGRRYHEFAGDGLASQCTRLTCGDGTLDPDEDCDDGNDVDGDGCNRDCRPSGQEIWTRSYASVGDVEDRCYAIAIDGQGNAAVIGHVSNAQTGFDLWVRKYTADGDDAWTWSKDGGAGLDEEGWSIEVDADDGFVIAGYLNRPDTGPDAWVAKLDADGLKVWEQAYDGGTAGIDQARGVTLLPDGDLALVGYATIDAVSDTELWLQRTSADGTSVRWTQTPAGIMDSGQPDRGHGITHDGGDVFAVGYRQQADLVQHHWIARIDAAGHDVWREDGPDADGWPSTLAAIEATGAGELLIMGSKTNPAGDVDIWMQRRTPDGVVTWDEIVASPGGSDDRGNGIVPTRDGGFIAAGELGAGAGSTDGWIRRYDANNREVWTDMVSGPAGGRDTIWDAGIDPQGNVIACGYTATPETGWDIWVRKYTP